MSAVGTVSFLSGRAVAIKADGTERELMLGDQVFADEMVKVSPDSSIEIAMEGGDPVRLDGGQNWLASSEAFTDSEGFDSSEAVASSSSIDNAIAATGNGQGAYLGADGGSDIDAIQAAILAGQDPTEVAEATAAGAGGDSGGNEGSSTVVVGRTAGEVAPEAGFGTEGINDGFPEIAEEEVIVIQDEPEEPVVVVTTETRTYIVEGESSTSEPYASGQEVQVGEPSVDVNVVDQTDEAGNVLVRTTTTTTTTNYETPTETTTTTPRTEFTETREVTTTTYPDGQVVTETTEWTQSGEPVELEPIVSTEPSDPFTRQTETSEVEVVEASSETVVETNTYIVTDESSTSEPEASGPEVQVGEPIVVVNVVDQTDEDGNVLVRTTTTTTTTNFETPTETTTTTPQTEVTESREKTTTTYADGTVVVTYTEWEDTGSESLDPIVTTEPSDPFTRQTETSEVEVVEASSETVVETNTYVVSGEPSTSEPEASGPEVQVGEPIVVVNVVDQTDEDGNVLVRTTTTTTTTNFETPTETTTTTPQTEVTESREKTTTTYADGTVVVTYTEWEDTGSQPLDPIVTTEPSDPFTRQTETSEVEVVEASSETVVETNTYIVSGEPSTSEPEASGPEVQVGEPVVVEETTYTQDQDGNQVPLKTTTTTTTNYETPTETTTTTPQTEVTESREKTTTTYADGTVVVTYTEWEDTGSESIDPIVTTDPSEPFTRQDVSVVVDNYPLATIDVTEVDVSPAGMLSVSGDYTATGGDGDLTTTITVTFENTEYDAVVNNDGTWTLEVANATTYADNAVYSVSATILTSDADGDQATATDTGSDATPLIGPESSQVEESEITDTTSGSFDITSTDAVAAIRVQDKNGDWINVTSGNTVSGVYGELSVDSLGNWTYTLSASSLDHDEQGADTVLDTFALQVEDADGDVDSNSLVITVVDDGPSGTLTNGTILNEGGASLSNLIDYDLGADGTGSVTLSYNGPALTSGGDDVIFTTTDSNNDGIQELIGTAGGSEVIRLEVPGGDATPEDGAFTLTMSDVIDLPFISVSVGISDLSVSGTTATYSSANGVTMTMEGSGDIKLSNAGGSDKLGVGNQNMDVGESLTISWDGEVANNIAFDLFDNAEGFAYSYVATLKDGSTYESGMIVGAGNGNIEPISIEGGYTQLILTVEDAPDVRQDKFKISGLDFDVEDPAGLDIEFGFEATDADGDKISGSVEVTVNDDVTSALSTDPADTSNLLYTDTNNDVV